MTGNSPASGELWQVKVGVLKRNADEGGVLEITMQRVPSFMVSITFVEVGSKFSLQSPASI